MSETKEQIEQRVREAFKDHIIRDHQMIYRTDCPNVEILTWGNKDGGSCHRVDYMLRNGALCVYGDLGEAIYRWYGSDISLEWIAGLNLGYFHGKCEASRTGARNMDWDNGEALKEMKSQVTNLLSGDLEYYREKNHPGAKEALREFLDTEGEKGALDILFSGDPELAFGDQDWWEWLPKCGEVIPVSTYYHLVGLKMAFGEVKPC